MKNVIKYFVLTFTLVIPVFLYLFLKYFGDNKYAIPVFYKEELGREVAGCFEIQLPHTVNLSKFQGLSMEVLEGVKVLNPVLDSCLDCPPNLNEAKRIMQRHPEINLLNLYVPQITSFQNSPKIVGNNWHTKEVNLPDMISILRCELLFEIPSETSIVEMNKMNQLVLLDEEDRIRGYYKKNDREDIDRLILEISILKQE